MNGRHLLRSKGFQVLLFGIPASLFYAWFITNGTFDFFGRERHGLAYGSLLMHMLHGSLEVDRHAIGLEGFFVGDKVYMYYGILPALLRLPFVPFVDLNTVTVSRVVVLCLAIAQAAVWHVLAIRVVDRSLPPTSPVGRIFLFCTIGITVWLISPSFALTTNASVFHEPIAAALLITSLYLLVVFTDIELKQKVGRRNLAYLALLAALCVHARPPMAIGLYLATVALVAIQVANSIRTAASPLGTARAAFQISVVPMSILAASGLAFLWLNWVRWGEPIESWPLRYYGYNLFYDRWAPSLEPAIELGRFNLSRIPANLAGNLFAVEAWVMELRKLFGAGNGRIGYPFAAIVLLWPLPLAGAAAAAARLASDRHEDRRVFINHVTVVVALAIPVLLLLSYPTISYRYKFMMWPLVAALALIGLPWIGPWIDSLKATTRVIVIYLVGASCVICLYYHATINVMYKLTPGFASDARMAIVDSPLGYLLPAGYRVGYLPRTLDEYEHWERALTWPHRTPGRQD